MTITIFSTALMLLLVMDPGGNLPLFISLLKDETPQRYRSIILRESLIALAILALFLFFGENILKLLQVSQLSLGLGGAVILFLIALKMIFGAPIMYPDQEKGRRELLIVPLAVPLLAGPSAITMTILMRNSQTLPVGVAALLLSWAGATLILLGGRRIAGVLGNHGLDALESLMGFLLAIVAIEMLVRGLRDVFVP